MMKNFLLASVLAMLFSVAYAQKPEIEFKARTHDLGKIKEEDGSITITFDFTNKGAEPLVISGVTASCGCTTPDWTKAPVAPGETGFVKATYHAKGRPGVFKKSVTVKSNASENVVVLTIAGEVVPRQLTVEEVYPEKAGDIRLKTRTAPTFEIYKNDTKTARLEIKNTSEKDVKLSFTDVPKYIILETNPTTLKPQATGVLVITYNAKDVDDYGSRTDSAYLVLNGKPLSTEEYKLIFNANIREDFRKLTAEQRANAPAAVFQTKSLSVDMKKGAKKRLELDLKNAGKEDLIIRKIKSDKSFVKITSPKAPIGAGKKEELKIEISDVAGMPSEFTAKITVITNDPKEPQAQILVNVRVLK